MGVYAINNPARCGTDVEKYNGWLMANIINDFAQQDLTSMDVRLAFRRALLISSEYARIAKGARIGV